MRFLTHLRRPVEKTNPEGDLPITGIVSFCSFIKAKIWGIHVVRDSENSRPEKEKHALINLALLVWRQLPKFQAHLPNGSSTAQLATVS